MSSNTIEMISYFPDLRGFKIYPFSEKVEVKNPSIREKSEEMKSSSVKLKAEEMKISSVREILDNRYFSSTFALTKKLISSPVLTKCSRQISSPMGCMSNLLRTSANTLRHPQNTQYRQLPWKVLKGGAVIGGCVATALCAYNLIKQHEEQKSKLIDQIQNQKTLKELEEVAKRFESLSGMLSPSVASKGSDQREWKMTNASVASMGSDQRKTINLLGAHSTGIIGYHFFSDGLYNFGGTGSLNTSMDTEFLKILRSRFNDGHSFASAASTSLSHPSSFNKIHYLIGQAGGPFYPLESGRRDTVVACPEIVPFELPIPDDDLPISIASNASDI